MSHVIPLLLLCVFACAIATKTNAYDSFVEGAKQGLPLVKNLLPYLACMLIAVELAKASGLYNLLDFLLSPFLQLVGIPAELSQLVLLRPFSGSGSLAILNDMLATYGTDSFLGRCACVIYGSSETVFYIATVYFGDTSVKKLGLSLVLGLFCSFLSSALACLFCRIF